MNAHTNKQIPVVDVDQAFPTMVDRPVPSSSGGNGAAGDVTPQVAMAVRDVLGMRPRTQDPKAFLDALRASFNLRLVEGHVVADYVPRGAAVMSDLGAVTGGQASLYRRATMARAEVLRILDGLTPLRPDADPEDMASYRTLVRDSVQRLVDELGNPGGPRVQMVDMYFSGLTGSKNVAAGVDADTVAGQLGALRDRFGLINDYSNTVDDEALRTSFWTMVDLVTDLQGTWEQQKLNFSSQAGQGFLGTDLIVLSRLMEAAADQVDELERVLDSVLIPESERRTIMLDSDKGLTLDGLLTWLRTYLGDEGRRIAQDTGRDGIVSALAPMAVEVVHTFKRVLADKLDHVGKQAGNSPIAGVTVPGDGNRTETVSPILYLPVSCCAPLPAGMYVARTQIAVASLSRLLMELAKTAQRISRFSQPILFDVTASLVQGREGVVLIELRGLNLRPEYAPAFLKSPISLPSGRGDLDAVDHLLVRCLEGSASWDDDTLSGYFLISDLVPLQGMGDIVKMLQLGNQITFPAESVALAVVDLQRDQALVSTSPVTYPSLGQASIPVTGFRDWTKIPTKGSPVIYAGRPVLPGEPSSTTPATQATTTGITEAAPSPANPAASASAEDAAIDAAIEAVIEAIVAAAVGAAVEAAVEGGVEQTAVATAVASAVGAAVDAAVGRTVDGTSLSADDMSAENAAYAEVETPADPPADTAANGAAQRPAAKKTTAKSTAAKKTTAKQTTEKKATAKKATAKASTTADRAGDQMTKAGSVTTSTSPKGQ